ncbi:MAG: 30S ribosomal protein S1 [Deltaproteobacteria bacterium CG07_land_8_20_14_0_80_38_7]|nr:MAG: 30S ribosomal protein S1 [Deltaproteobacteria bacterium CG07_land_8_20_14_0_80_38_7]
MCPVQIEPTEEQKSTEFAQLFEESVKKLSLKEGDIVKGRIIKLTRDFVIVDIGFKSEGRIPIEEFKSAGGDIKANVGDNIEVLLESVENEDGLMILSKERADSIKMWNRLEELEAGDGIIEGVVISKVKGGLAVDIGVKAFLPGSQVDFRPVRTLDKYVGKAFKFKIVKLNKRRGNVVLSRKALLEKERESLKETTLANLAEGQVFDGIIKNVTDYGAFVDIGGIDGLLHVTDMSWGRINHPSEMYEVGDEVRVVILKYDEANQKVSLGVKQLTEDPWQNVEERYPVGSRIKGRVTNITDFGAFVEISDGVEGLIHVTEMSWTKKVKHPSKVVTVEDEVETIVLNIDVDNKRISLGLKQIEPNPWVSLEQQYPIGSKVKGKIRNVADFGVFVDVGGPVDGLVHVSDLVWVQNFNMPDEAYNKNDDIEAVVLHVDPENERFSLGVKHLTEDPWEKIKKEYPEGIKADGEVVTINSAGAVIRLEDGIEGLVQEKEQVETLKEKDKVEVSVDKIMERERKFLLSLKKAN